MRNGLCRMMLGGALGLFGIAAPAQAGTVFFDPFTDGNAVGGADAQGGSWYANANGGTAGSVAVSPDAILPARGASNSNALVYSPAATFQATVASFASQALAVNDSITLTFDFRFNNAPSNGGAFRFGLYNDGGSPATANGASADRTNDLGYYVSFNTGTGTGGTAFRENGGTPSILGGVDRNQIGAGSTTATNIVGTEAHAVLMTLTRTGASTMTVLAQIDGTTILNVSDTAATPFTFDELAISPAGHTIPLAIDNVTVTSTVVPEPGALAWLALATLPMLRRRR